MASNRHLGRIIALQTLYECDFRAGSHDDGLDVKEVLKRNINRYHGQVDDLKFVERLVETVLKEQQKLDAEIQPIAPEWPLEQIARVDRAILRIGWCELKYEPDVPPKVVINEAVELAKAFGGENSSKFVNGVLGTLLKNEQPTAEPSEAATTKSSKKVKSTNSAKQRSQATKGPGKKSG